VWAITELKGITQGSYLSAYGLVYCESCQATLKKDMPQCPHCLHKRDPEPERESSISSVPAENRWSEAYGKKCDRCMKLYPRHLPKCPRCYQSPDQFFAAMEKFTGANPGWSHGSYLGVWKRGLR